MKTKLKKFDEFAHSLFPHEIEYILSIQQFQNNENIEIIKKIQENLISEKKVYSFDTELDKRRYSNLKKWIEEKLEAIDVDLLLKWILNFDEKILTDIISVDEEQFILQKLKQINPTFFHFIRFYEMIEHYRDYLLIRVRKQYYKPVFEFLSENYLKYTQAVEINKQLNLATRDIIQRSIISENEFTQWENFLFETLSNIQLNGDTRYKALIRLSLYYYKSQNYAKLKDLYVAIDKEFTSSTFYSKRILANYYANRSLVLAKCSEPKEAERFAYLAIKIKNNDYLFYINNLLYILQQQKKYTDALKIATATIPLLKQSIGFYHRIGFTSLYIKTLNNIKQAAKAVSYAQSFFEVYKKEIFEHRWHLFFTSFFEALLLEEKYEIILSYCKRFQLIKLEKKEQNLKFQNNILYWYSLLAQYMTAQITEEKIKKEFQILLESKSISSKNKLSNGILNNELKEYFPDFISLFNKNVPQEAFIF